MKILKRLLECQLKLSRVIDQLLPQKFRLHASHDFNYSLIPSYLRHNLKIYDVGGGNKPSIKLDLKTRLGLRIVGLDISRSALENAPKGLYDEMICADVTEYQGKGDSDLIICHFLLEHVKDVDRAFAAIASILKEGGVALIAVPSKNAIFSRLNRFLPHALKNIILKAIGSQENVIAYYDRCTSQDFYQLAKKHTLLVEEVRYYFTSHYFFYFFPAYLMWRFMCIIFYCFYGNQAAEMFCMALKKTRI